jgi:hypothetical protein
VLKHGMLKMVWRERPRRPGGGGLRTFPKGGDTPFRFCNGKQSRSPEECDGEDADGG